MMRDMRKFSSLAIPTGWFISGGEKITPRPDGDGLTDPEELALGTDPRKRDTDGDKLPDGWEVEQGFDPLVNNDTDSDPDNCVKLRAVCAKNSNYKILHVLAQGSCYNARNGNGTW